MKLGLLWYDNDPKKTLERKVLEAAIRYREKFGSEPNVCYVNPTQLEGQIVPPTFRFVGMKTIRPNHFWLEHEAV